MKANILCAAIAALLAGSAALAAACSSPPPARLPDNVFAAIAYNGQADRWHAGVSVSGDRLTSSLRVVCLTEAGKPWAASDRQHTGINVDAQPGEPGRTEWRWSSNSNASGTGETEGLWALDWSWRLDAEPWQGGRWTLSTSIRPATVVAADLDVGAAFLRDLREAKTAELIGAKDGQEQLSVRFDLAALFDTPVQFAIDDCNQAAIEAQTGSYHHAYAYWFPDTNRHTFIFTERDPDTERALLLSCGPTSWTGEDEPAWIREAHGGLYAAATLLVLPDPDEPTAITGASSQTGGPAPTPAIESATVTWTNQDGQTGTAVWNANHHWLQPQSASENLQFIEILRDSEQLTVTVEAPTLEPTEITLHGAALFNKPMGPELDACIREYAELNG